MKKQTKKIILVLSVIILLGLILYFGFIKNQVISQPTAYVTVTYTSNSIIYSNPYSPDYNSLTTDHVFKSCLGQYCRVIGNLGTNFANPDVNPGLIQYWLTNYIGINPNDLKSCGTDRYDRYSSCGISPAICPIDENALMRTTNLLQTKGLSWSANPSEYPCPDSPNKKFMKSIPENIMINLSNKLICEAKGTYSICENNGNTCGSENNYNLLGYVTWEGSEGFDCHVNINTLPGGDLRIKGSVEFRMPIEKNIYRFANNMCSQQTILENMITTNDYLTYNECYQNIQIPIINDSIVDEPIINDSIVDEPIIIGTCENTINMCGGPCPPCKIIKKSYFKYFIYGIIGLILLIGILIIVIQIRKK